LDAPGNYLNWPPAQWGFEAKKKEKSELGLKDRPARALFDVISMFHFRHGEVFLVSVVCGFE
jgi:hypothetical protein